MNPNDTFNEVIQRLDSVGDMPIFSATVNRIQMVSGNPNADAMQLAMEVLKDASLSAKVLRLINSPYYNRGVGKISSLSRAVVLLGFDTVRNTTLTLKLIDSFNKEHPGLDMNALLVNAYLSAGFVSSLAMACGSRDVELSYVCGLLHNLGEIVIAHTLSDKYVALVELMNGGGVSWEDAQRQILGTTARKIGQELVTRWEFPLTVASSMSLPSLSRGGMITDKNDLNGMLSSYANSMMDNLYAKRRTDQKSFAELTLELAKAIGLSSDAVGKCLSESFKKSCDLAEAYGLNKKHLMPLVKDSTDHDRDRVAREFAFYAGHHGSRPIETADAPAAAAAAPVRPIAAPSASRGGAGSGAPGQTHNPGLLLDLLSDITTLITEHAPPNRVFAAVLEGMQQGAGFDHALLCLLTPDRKTYVARAALGRRSDQLKAYFNLPINPGGDAFSALIMDGHVLQVDKVDAGWLGKLPRGFAEQVGAPSFIVAALRVHDKPMGLFYADKSVSGAPITTQDQRSFLQLVAQAKLALQIR